MTGLDDDEVLQGVAALLSEMGLSQIRMQDASFDDRLPEVLRDPERSEQLQQGIEAGFGASVSAASIREATTARELVDLIQSSST